MFPVWIGREQKNPGRFAPEKRRKRERRKKDEEINVRERLVKCYKKLGGKAKIFCVDLLSHLSQVCELKCTYIADLKKDPSHTFHRCVN